MKQDSNSGSKSSKTNNVEDTADFRLSQLLKSNNKLREDDVYVDDDVEEIKDGFMKPQRSSSSGSGNGFQMEVANNEGEEPEYVEGVDS